MLEQNKLIVFILIFLINCQLIAQSAVIYPKKEFRAVWIATVVNIDWPKKATDSIEKHQADFIEILDTYKKLNFNAVIVQVRSVGDAFYHSKLAPWSRYLTGKEGLASHPYYDPLIWMIEQAHKRGFEFHAWLNPFRATFDLKTETLSPSHDYNKHRNWMIKYGEKGKEKFYYDPGIPEVRKHLVSVVEEVVQNYDIDAIHFDDYFYPYRVQGKKFNDSASYRKYKNNKSLEDWRRANVNTYLQETYTAIKAIKPWVQFGISPFGVWRNKSVDRRGSDTQAGQTNYDDLYADTMAWMEGKYIDYMLPQLYWSIKHQTASHATLIDWWSKNTPNTNLYIGNSSYKINKDSDKNWLNPAELPNQIDLARSYSNILGNAFFSAKYFVNDNPEVVALLRERQYKYPALPPAVPVAAKQKIERPSFDRFIEDKSCYSFIFKKEHLEQIRYLIVYTASDKQKIDQNDPSQISEKIAIDKKLDSLTYLIAKSRLQNTKYIGFTFVDFYGNESDLQTINLKTELKTK